LGAFYRDTIKRLRKMIRSGDFVLDVGSGSSPYTALFNNQIVTIDVPQKGQFGFSQEVLNEIKLRKNLSAVVACGEALPFKARSFDKIICTEVLEHIYDDKTMVSEMARVLKNEGSVFLTTPNENGIPIECGIKEHIRHYTDEGLYGLLSQFFREAIIERRFALWHFLSVGIVFMTRWNKNRLYMHFLLASLLSSSIYDIIQPLERYWSSNNKEYNLVAFCSKPLRTI
jgi:ubiquinone/menaquinone biosynthesis C-methylase UbiE